MTSTAARSRARLAATVLFLVASGGAALADCYDVFGCSNRDVFAYRDLVSGPNCEFLYQMRNRIYQENGYCFATARGIATFGNEGCRYRSDDAVPMNRIERTNVATIKKAEAALGCR